MVNPLRHLRKGPHTNDPWLPHALANQKRLLHVHLCVFLLNLSIKEFCFLIIFGFFDRMKKLVFNVLYHMYCIYKYSLKYVQIKIGHDFHISSV